MERRRILSGVERAANSEPLRDREVAGSNPVAPTIFQNPRPSLHQSIFTRRRNCWFSLQIASMISSSTVRR